MTPPLLLLLLLLLLLDGSCCCRLLPSGVHLNIKIVRSLLSRHHDVIPFLVHIGSEAKHVERHGCEGQVHDSGPS